MAAEPAQKMTSLPTKGTDRIKADLESLRSHDLVFAVVAHAGSGASMVAEQLIDQLKRKKFITHRIKISELIEEAGQKLGLLTKEMLLSLRGVKKAEALQDAGDNLRKSLGESFIASLGVARAAQIREAEQDKGSNIALVFDSLKHPDEVNLLRTVYGSSFYLISVICRPDIRSNRLKIKYKHDDPNQIEILARRDEVGGSSFGQNVRKTIHLGDYFVSNDSDNLQILADDLGRLIDIIVGGDVCGPTFDEHGMYIAQGAAYESSCLSRQIGASILDKNGEILATGRNDVPRAGGGLYSSNDKGKDYRCFGYLGYCANDKRKADIYSNIFQMLNESNILDKHIKEKTVVDALKATPIRDLIEFSRAVHAEMDAIISVARKGKISIQDAILYTTTYPCHSCARHIVAAGIKEVVYIEPYPKSLAIGLHNDSIKEVTSVQEASDGKVSFRLFSGVAPRRYRALFEKRIEWKDESGDITIRSEDVTHHRDPVLVKSFLELEKTVAQLVSEQLQEVVANAKEQS